MAGELPVLAELADLAVMVERSGGLYVRWSRGPAEDLAGPDSVDQLTGVPLPGLSASPLDVEPWWDGRPVRLWVARRLYDYSHLRWDKGPGVRPWVLRGHEAGRGPDNEPLVRDACPVAWIAHAVIEEADREIAGAQGEWGPLRRGRPNPSRPAR